MDELTVKFEGKYYTIHEYEFDISDQFGKPENTIEIINVIEGFEVDLYLVVDNDEGVFFFGHEAAEGTGLFVSLQDEMINEKASRLVSNIFGGQ